MTTNIRTYNIVLEDVLHVELIYLRLRPLRLWIHSQETLYCAIQRCILLDHDDRIPAVGAVLHATLDPVTEAAPTVGVQTGH